MRPYELYRPLNYYFQSSAADVVARSRMTYQYHVCNERGEPLSHAVSEADAIRDAESRARATPGSAYYVTKAIAKSFVAPVPSITTRL